MKQVIELVKENGTVYATSRQVASDFGKQHGHVLRDIDALIKDASKIGDMFVETIILDKYKRKQRAYNITKDGFTLLAMGFTGKKALQFKLDYIQAFNEMEQELKDINQIANAKGYITSKELDEVKEFSTAQRVRKTFTNTNDMFDAYERFTYYSRRSLDVKKRITRLNQIVETLKQRENELYKNQHRGWKAERENIIELIEVILRDINEINNRSYGKKLGYLKSKAN